MQNGEKKVWNSDVLHRGRFIIIWNSPINNVNIDDDHVNTAYSSGTNAYDNDVNCESVKCAKDCYSNDHVIKTSNVPNEQSTVRSAKTKGMQIAHLNIVTLPGHFDEFISLMQDNEFDIMSLSETRLDEYNQGSIVQHS